MILSALWAQLERYCSIIMHPNLSPGATTLSYDITVLSFDYRIGGWPQGSLSPSDIFVT
jgi:hypothetical protein